MRALEVATARSGCRRSSYRRDASAREGAQGCDEARYAVLEGAGIVDHRIGGGGVEIFDTARETGRDLRLWLTAAGRHPAGADVDRAVHEDDLHRRVARARRGNRHARGVEDRRAALGDHLVEAARDAVVQAMSTPGQRVLAASKAHLELRVGHRREAFGGVGWPRDVARDEGEARVGRESGACARDQRILADAARPHDQGDGARPSARRCGSLVRQRGSLPGRPRARSADRRPRARARDRRACPARSRPGRRDPTPSRD